MVVSEDFRYDDLVFAIHLDDAFSLSGDNLAFTYAEYQQIDHPDSTDHDESIALTINFDVTGPGGTTSAKVTLLVADDGPKADGRSEEHTSELQSLMRNTYAGVCFQTQTIA